MEAQLQIRQNAMEVQEYMQDLFRWEQSVKAKRAKQAPAAAGRKPSPADSDVPAVRGRAAGALIQEAPKDLQCPALSGRSSGGAAGGASSSGAARTAAAAAASRHPAAHTYANYSKWDKFNVDAALVEGGPSDEESAGHGGSAGSSSGRGAALQPPSAPAVLPPRSTRPAAGSAAAAGSIRGQLSQPPAQGPKHHAQQISPGVSSSTSGVAAAAGSGGGGTPSGSEASTAVSWKDRGNALLQAGHLVEAVECYGRSIDIEPTCLAYANRALVHLKLLAPMAAEDDCTTAMALDSGYVKAHMRRGAARAAQGNWVGAAQDYEGALRLEPGNREARQQRQECLDKHLRGAGLVGAPAPRQRVLVVAGAAAATAVPPPQQQRAAPAPVEAAAGGASGSAAALAAAAAAPGTAAVAAMLAAKAAASAPSTLFGSVRQPVTAAPPAQAGAAGLPARQQEQGAAAQRAPAAGAGAGAATADAAAAAESGHAGSRPAPAATTSSPTTSRPQQPPQHSPSPSSSPAATAATTPVQATAAPAADAPAQPNAGADAAAAPATSASAAAGAGAVAAAARRAVTSVAGSPPRTAFEFEAVWRSLRGDATAQQQFVQLLEPAQVPCLLKTLLDAPLLVALQRALLAPFVPGECAAGGAGEQLQRRQQRAAELLAALVGVPRFDMAAMCVGSRDKAGLRGLWDSALAADGAAAAAGAQQQLAALRPRFRV